MEKLTSALEDWRRNSGLTQTQIAEKLDVSQANYAMWLARGAVPSRHIQRVKDMISTGAGSPVGVLVEMLDCDPAMKEFAKRIPDLPEQSRIIIARIALR